jgi:hypothetical protein
MWGAIAAVAFFSSGAEAGLTLAGLLILFCLWVAMRVTLTSRIERTEQALKLNRQAAEE